MSPATVTENEGECETSEPVQYPLLVGHLCIGREGRTREETLQAWREKLDFLKSWLCQDTLCDNWAGITSLWAEDWSGNAGAGEEV